MSLSYFSELFFFRHITFPTLSSLCGHHKTQQPGTKGIRIDYPCRRFISASEESWLHKDFCTIIWRVSLHGGVLKLSGSRESKGNSHRNVYREEGERGKGTVRSTRTQVTPASKSFTRVSTSLEEGPNVMTAAEWRFTQHESSFMNWGLAILVANRLLCLCPKVYFIWEAHNPFLDVCSKACVRSF